MCCSSVKIFLGNKTYECHELVFATEQNEFSFDNCNHNYNEVIYCLHMTLVYTVVGSLTWLV